MLCGRAILPTQKEKKLNFKKIHEVVDFIVHNSDVCWKDWKEGI